MVLWLASAAFIVYGTTLPFNFSPDRRVALEHLARVTWHPLISPDTGDRVSIPDFVGNVLLFTPFGCFGIWALGRPRSAIAKIILLVMLGAVLSAAVETMQLFTFDRTSSVADVFANTLGGLAGAVAGVVVGTTADAFIARAAAAGLTDSATFYPLLIATIVVVAGAWEPFDVTLDVGSVMPKLRLFLQDPLQLGALTDEGLSFLQHLLFTSALVMWLKEARIRSAMKRAAFAGVLVAVGCEGAQLFISARMPGLEDAGVAAVGALVGVAAGLEFRRSTSYARWCAGLVGLTAIGVAMQQLSPFQITETVRPFQWMPFLNYYAFTTSETVSHSAELLLGYFPLGFGLALAVQKPAMRLAVVLGVALAIAVPVEYLQRFIGGRYPDITDIGLSVAGAWLGAWTATQGWRLFDEQMALPRQSLAR
jgi:VanZ family protein